MSTEQQRHQMTSNAWLIVEAGITRRDQRNRRKIDSGSLVPSINKHLVRPEDWPADRSEYAEAGVFRAAQVLTALRLTYIIQVFVRSCA